MPQTIRRFVISAFMVLVGVSRVVGQPIVDEAVGTAGEPVKVYHDRLNPNIYWYIPLSIEPWARNNQYKSQLTRHGNNLTFVFRGQASVDMNTLSRVAAANNTDVRNFTPIAYDYSRNLTCQNVFVGEALQWVWPKMIGNYLEVVPVSLRTTNKDLADELEELIKGNGLACTVEVGFKAVYTAYHLKMTADMNRVYQKFQAAAHAEGLWWEVDVATTLQQLRTDGVIQFDVVQDVSVPNTPLDTQVLKATDEIVKKVTAALFTPALTLPSGDLPGRGKAWSLRASFVKSEEMAHYVVELNSRNISVKDSQIGLRLALQ